MKKNRGPLNPVGKGIQVVTWPGVHRDITEKNILSKAQFSFRHDGCQHGLLPFHFTILVLATAIAFGRSKSITALRSVEVEGSPSHKENTQDHIYWMVTIPDHTGEEWRTRLECLDIIKSLFHPQVATVSINSSVNSPTDLVWDNSLKCPTFTYVGKILGFWWHVGTRLFQTSSSPEVLIMPPAPLFQLTVGLISSQILLSNVQLWLMLGWTSTTHLPGDIFGGTKW